MTLEPLIDADDALTFISAADPSIGLCAESPCATDGSLITTNELKTEFRNRDFISAATPDKQIWVGKDEGASASVYACYVPLSQSERAKTENLVSLAFDTNGAPTECTTTDWVNSPCYTCLPQ